MMFGRGLAAGELVCPANFCGVGFRSSDIQWQIFSYHWGLDLRRWKKLQEQKFIFKDFDKKFCMFIILSNFCDYVA